MSQDVQKRFLRVLQSHTVTRIGDYEPIPVDIMVIAATNRNLEKEVVEKNFREDLFYRLNVINIHIPPLRDRIEDVEPLVEFFINKLSKTVGKTNVIISDDAFTYLFNYYWPGNVRELENVIERSLNLIDGNIITSNYLPEKIINANYFKDIKNKESLSILERNEMECIVKALRKCKGNKKQAAEMLGISRSTLYDKIEKYNIQ